MDSCVCCGAIVPGGGWSAASARNTGRKRRREESGMWEYIIPAISAIVVAAIEAVAAKDRKRAKKREETLKRHEQQRAEETRLAMAMNSATLQLCVVTANALTGGHNNGNVERARQAAQQAEAEYDAFVQRLAANQVAKL